MTSSQSLQWFWDGLDSYLARNQLKQTKQRRLIVDQFLKLDGHIEAEDLYAAVRKKGHNIGLATVYRTLNLLKDAQLVEQSSFSDGRAVFERIEPGSHHDHLVCLECGHIVEFENDTIEELQEQIALKFNFRLITHKLELYGTCNDRDACSIRKEKRRLSN